MKVIPFGEVIEDRFELSKRYSLIEMTSGFWKLTKKCRDNYEPISFIKYLKGDLKEPEKTSERKLETRKSLIDAICRL